MSPAEPEPTMPLPRPVTRAPGPGRARRIRGRAAGFGGTIGPAFLALVLVVTAHAVQSWLGRRGAPGWVGVVILLVAVYGILLVLAAALTLSVARLATLLPPYGPQFADLRDQPIRGLADLGVGQDEINTALGRLNLVDLIGTLQRILGSVSSVVSDLRVSSPSRHGG